MPDDLTNCIVVFIVIMVFAIPLHEFGHALAADYFGDDIPSLQGRVTLEPWVHWDFWGSVLIALGIFHGFAVIGWGKPVITDPLNYRSLRKGWILVSAAGILVNLLLALLGAAGFRFAHMETGDPFFRFVLEAFVFINISLAIFNLLPIPPLDGSKILMWLLPPEIAVKYDQVFRGIGFFVIYLIIWFAPQLVYTPVDQIVTWLLGAAPVLR